MSPVSDRENSGDSRAGYFGSVWFSGVSLLPTVILFRKRKLVTRERRVARMLMSFDLLLVAIVREASALIAAAATHKGARTSLAHLGDHLFYGLARELHALGVRRRVAADMLGMAPRAYLRKLRRVEESVTDRGRCLWEAVYEYASEHGPVTRTALHERFHRDDAEALRGVLSDLEETGAILCEGRGGNATFRAATPPELEGHLKAFGDATAALVWTFIHHEGPTTRAELQRHGIKPSDLERALTQLLASGRVRAEEVEGETRFRSAAYKIPIGTNSHGAILDHFHGVTKALGTILNHPDEPAAASTYKFDVWPGHPMADESKELFREWRRRASELMERIDSYNATAEHPPPEPMILYLGLSKDVQSKRRDNPSS
jgi:hypothetical protein